MGGERRRGSAYYIKRHTGKSGGRRVSRLWALESEEFERPNPGIFAKLPSKSGTKIHREVEK